MSLHISSTMFNAGRKPLVAIASTLIFFGSAQTPVNSVGQLSGSARISGSLSLSSGSTGAGLALPVGPSSGVQATSTSAIGSEITELIDFGDLSKGSGEKATAVIRLRLRGNAPYRLNVSESSYAAQSLQVRGKDVSGSQDRGSFVELRVGNIIGSGAKSNASGTRLNAQLENGQTLSSISQGPLSADSTNLAAGESPSLSGTASSSDNALEIPLYFSVPTGYEVGPTAGNARGSFQITLQIGAFAGR